MKLYGIHIFFMAWKFIQKKMPFQPSTHESKLSSISPDLFKCMIMSLQWGRRLIKSEYLSLQNLLKPRREWKFNEENVGKILFPLNLQKSGSLTFQIWTFRNKGFFLYEINWDCNFHEKHIKFFLAFTTFFPLFFHFQKSLFK